MRERVVLFDANTSYAGAPLALLSITCLLEPDEYEIHIITKREFPDYERRILDLCSGALCFGVTCITGEPIKAALAVSSAVKQAFPDLPIIWGGWQPITLPELTLQHPAIDYICTCQGERAFPEFLEALRDGDLSALSSVRGLGFKRDGGIVLNDERRPEDINNFPDYNVDLIDWTKHVESYQFGKRMIRVTTSFGCPYRCAFCSEHNYCRRFWRGLSAERIITLLLRIREKVDFDSLSFTDNNFFVDEQRVVDFCNGLIESGLHLNYGGVSARTNTLVKYKPETWMLLRESGLRDVLIGAESANDATLQLINKDANVSQTIELCVLCEEYGVKATLSFVLGFPLPQYFSCDPAEAFEEELGEVYALFKRIHSEITRNFQFFVFFYAPLPAPPLYYESIKRGYVPPKTLAGWADYQLWHIHTPWLRRAKTNGSRIRVFKFITLVLGLDYTAYLEQTPWFIRVPGVALVKLVKALSHLRLKHDVLACPLEVYIFEFSERCFRKLNRLRPMVGLSD